jgi:hypothetical protein
VKGECDKCGWDKTDMDTACVARYIQMQKDDVLVKFQQYGKASHAEATVATGDSDSDAYGERQKNRDEVQKVDYELPLSEFMQKYCEVSAAFFEHRELAHWQAEQFDKCVDNLPEGHIAALIDYSMNYSHNHATAVQGKLRTSARKPALVLHMHASF